MVYFLGVRHNEAEDRIFQRDPILGAMLGGKPRNFQDKETGMVL